MSLPVEWAFDAIAGSGLTSNARLVLLIVADHADHADGSNAWPSIGRIAAYAGMHRSTVTAALSELERDGLLIREGKGMRGVTRWRVPCVAEDDTSEDTGATYAR